MTRRITITRSVGLPDPLKLARFRKAPEIGPRVLFFSGGTALRDACPRLVEHTHNSIHLITPFDSGGSSAVIRKAFDMIAVGDLRSRLLALADRSLTGNPAIFTLFAHRLPKDSTVAGDADLRRQLADMIEGTDPLVRAVTDPMRTIIRRHLSFFREHMPKDFDLRGASVGNLILAGGYFNHDRHIDPVIYLFSKLVEARGVVLPVSGRHLHLAAELEDGRILVGQHLLTGKETLPIDSPVKSLRLVEPDSLAPSTVEIRDKVRDIIATAELVCYPIGSFYSSLIANLLPMGVGLAVSRAGCPKVYVPNPGPDPEQFGMTLHDCVARLLDYLRASCGPAGRDVPTASLLTHVLVDTASGLYPGPLVPDDLEALEALGIQVVDAPFVSRPGQDPVPPVADPSLLIDTILSLV